MKIFTKIEEDHIRPKLPFGSHKICVKCGGSEFSRTFVPYRAQIEIAVYYYEHIEAKCKNCGAVYSELPKDASDRMLKRDAL
jgi:predicted nucleic-acid-binding Zn-ribbon protein